MKDYDPSKITVSPEWYNDNGLGMPFPEYMISRSTIEIYVFNEEGRYDNVEIGETLTIRHIDISESYEYEIIGMSMDYKTGTKTIRARNGKRVSDE